MDAAYFAADAELVAGYKWLTLSISPGLYFRLFRCERCFALVSPDDGFRHDAWHDRLDGTF